MRFVAVRFFAVLILAGSAFPTTPVGAQSPSPAPSPLASAAPVPPAPGACIDPRTQQAFPAPHLPPPPDAFDPSVIPWVGDFGGYSGIGATFGGGETGWAGTLAGPPFRQLPDEVSTVRRASDGRLVATVGDPSELVVIDPDGTRQVLPVSDPDSRFVLDLAGKTVYVNQSRFVGHRTLRIRADLWRVPLDGPPPKRLLARLGGAGKVAVSPDGTTVAVDWYILDDGPGWLVAKVVGHESIRLKNVGLIGIDVGGQVIGIDNGGYLRIDPRTGHRSRIPLGRSDYAEDDLVTPSGRYLVSFGGRSPDTNLLTARDLVGGTLRRWTLPDDAEDWVLTDLGADRYVVLGNLDFDAFTVTEWAIVDLEEGWLGFIGFCPPLATEAVTASPTP